MRSSHTPASPESRQAETTAAMPMTAEWEPLAWLGLGLGLAGAGVGAPRLLGDLGRLTTYYLLLTTRLLGDLGRLTTDYLLLATYYSPPRRPWATARARCR
eukprot:scaffold105603_cov57-Phaeocystis_antarctica.AAC.2